MDYWLEQKAGVEQDEQGATTHQLRKRERGLRSRYDANQRETKE